MKPYRILTAALAAALLCALLAPAYVAAAGKDPYGENTPLNLPTDAPAKVADVGGGTGGGLARTFVGLAVVVGRHLRPHLGAAPDQEVQSDARTRRLRASSTEASMPLGPNRSLHLIRAGRELVLVGSAEHGIVPIRTYTEDEARDLGLLQSTRRRRRRSTGRRATAADERQAAPSATRFDRLRDRTAR